MHSGFAASFYESLGGIRPDDANPGFKNFFLKPTFIPNLEWVKVSLQSPQGKILSAWKRQDGKITWSLTVPENSTAEIELPAYSAKQITLNAKAVKTNHFILSSGFYVLHIDE